ncbi:MAG: NUDIX hydrolase [Brevundimonas sp.]
MFDWLRRLRTRSALRPPADADATAAGMPVSDAPARHQVAALPWRRGTDGLEIMLVTSRETRRWVTPKGGRMAGKTDAEAAAIEAMEEAGVQGEVQDRPLGTFRYLKILKRRAPRWCVVAVYPLEVTIQHGAWKEQAERERVWMSVEQAADCVGEPDLAEIIRTFRP